MKPAEFAELCAYVRANMDEDANDVLDALLAAFELGEGEACMHDAEAIERGECPDSGTLMGDAVKALLRLVGRTGFRESALSTFDPAANRTRVCAAHVSGSPAPHPEKYARTGQGLPVVPVIRYIDDPEG